MSDSAVAGVHELLRCRREERAMVLLTADQQQALDRSDEYVLGRFTDSEGAVHVLLPSDDFDWMCNLLGDEPDQPRLA